MYSTIGNVALTNISRVLSTSLNSCSVFQANSSNKFSGQGEGTQFSVVNCASFCERIFSSSCNHSVHLITKIK